MVKIIVKTVVNTMASNRENRGEKQMNSISLRFQLERHSHIFHVSFHFRFHFRFHSSLWHPVGAQTKKLKNPKQPLCSEAANGPHRADWQSARWGPFAASKKPKNRKTEKTEKT